MVKLCFVCGFINSDDALECEECHSAFNSKFSSLSNNFDIKEKNISLENHQYTLDDINKKSNNTSDEFFSNPIQDSESDNTEISSNHVSNFLYDSSQKNTLYESINPLETSNDFELTSFFDCLYENIDLSTNTNTLDSSHNNIEKGDEFDAEDDVTNIPHNDYNKDKLIEESVIASLDNDIIDRKTRPLDIIYSDYHPKDVSSFLNDNAIKEEDVDNAILDKNAIDESDILIETLPTVQEEYHPIINELNDIEKPILYEEHTYDNNIVKESNSNDRITNNYLQTKNIIEETHKNIDLSTNTNTLDSSHNNIEKGDEFDAEDDVTNIPHNDYNKDKLIEESVIASLDNDIIDRKTRPLDIIYSDYHPKDVSSFLNDNAIKEEDVDNAILDKNAIDESDKQNSSFERNNYNENLFDRYRDSKPLDTSSNGSLDSNYVLTNMINDNLALPNNHDSIEEFSINTINQKDNSDSEDDIDTIGPLERIKYNNNDVEIHNLSDFSKIKPMEIRRKNTDNKIHSADINNDEELADAFDVFKNIDPYMKENEKTETVLYDNFSPESIIYTEESTNQTEISKNDSNKSKIDNNIKQLKKPLSKKQIFIRKSIAISISITIIIIAVVIVSKINKEKELNAYATKLSANNDVSYTFLYNSLIEKGYSEDESFNVIESLNIDFADNALNIIYTIAQDSNKLSTKEEVKNILVGKGFTNNEIEKAMSIVDWSKYLNIYIDACVAKVKELDKNSIIETIQKAKYTTTEIEYIKRNYNWTKLAKKNLDSYLKSEDELHTKKDAENHLIEIGYSEQDIKDTFKNYEWGVYAHQYLIKYLQQKEENGITIESSRVSYTQILKDANFSEEEIELVMDRFDFVSYAKSKIDTTINDKSDFVDKNKVKELLEKEGYTKEEISSALKETDWNTTAIDSLKSLDNRKLSKKEMIQKLIDGGYSEKEIEYVNKNYNWSDQAENYLAFIRSEKKNGNEEHLRSLLLDSGYTIEEINKLIEKIDRNLDYFKNAAKEDIADISSDSDFSRKKVRNFLTNLNYGNDEINAAIKSYSDRWGSIASTFIKGINLSSRLNARKTLQDEEFTNIEIESAISSVSWSSICNDYARSIYDQESNEDKCNDYKEYKNGGKMGTSIAKALIMVEFTEKETIEALDRIFSIAPCTIN